VKEEQGGEAFMAVVRSAGLCCQTSAGRELHIQAILGIIRGLEAGFVFAVAQHHTTINLGEGPPYSTARAFQRCLSGASDDMLEQQVETYVARNPSSVTEPMVVVVVKTLHDLCRSEIEKGAAR
jgi:hypothetical protein